MGQTVVGHPVVIGGLPDANGGYYGGYPAQQQYGQQQYGGQPGYAQAGMAGFPAGPAEDPTIPAIVACFCCCWCIGIIAIIKAQEVQQANMQGNFQMAHAKRREAMQWIYITVCIGILFTVGNWVLRMALSGDENAEGGQSSGRT